MASWLTISISRILPHGEVWYLPTPGTSIGQNIGPLLSKISTNRNLKFTTHTKSFHKEINIWLLFALQQFFKNCHCFHGILRIIIFVYMLSYIHFSNCFGTYCLIYVRHMVVNNYVNKRKTKARKKNKIWLIAHKVCIR